MSSGCSCEAVLDDYVAIFGRLERAARHPKLHVMAKKPAGVSVEDFRHYIKATFAPNVAKVATTGISMAMAKGNGGKAPSLASAHCVGWWSIAILNWTASVF